MKRLVTILLLIAACMSVFAQGAIKKIFDEAIKNGPNQNGVYVFDNKKYKDVKADKVREYIISRGYRPIHYSNVTVFRFGDSKDVLEQYFFRKDESDDSESMAKYVFSKMETDGYNMTKRNGRYYILKEEDVWGKSNLSSPISFKRGKAYRFVPCNIAWNGTVKNGLLEGSGEGFASKGNTYTYIRGTFSNGLPTTSIREVTLQPEQGIAAYRNYGVNERINKEYKTHQPYDARILAMNVETSDPQLKEAIRKECEKTYAKDVTLLEQAYAKAAKLNMSNYGKLEAEEAPGIFYTLYKGSGYDPQNKIRKAYELTELYKLTEAMNVKLSDKYYGWIFVWFIWFGGMEDADTKALDTGIQIAEELAKESQYGFKDFGSKAQQQLVAKRKALSEKLIAQRNDYRRLCIEMEKEHRAMKAEADRKEAIQKDTYKEIDWNASKEPSGELARTCWPCLYYDYTYENDGVIVFNNRNHSRYKYNLVFDKDKKFKYFETLDYYPKRYDTSKEMLDDIVKYEAERKY